MRGMERWEIIAVIALSFAAFALMVFPFVKSLDSDVIPISLTYDNFYHPSMAKAVHDTQQHRVYAPYRVLGIKDALLADPPLPYSIPATVSMVTGIPVYNMFAILVSLFQIFMCLGVYAIARKYFNPVLAVFALAIALIPATYSWLFQYIIGFSTSLEAFAFVPLILFLTLYLYDKKSVLASVLIGAALAVQMMIHGPIECAYVYIFISAAMGVMWWRTKDKLLLKSWIWMSCSAAVLGGYQFLLLNLLRLSGENISGTLLAGNPIPSYFPNPELGWVLAGLAIIGGIVLLLRVLQKKSPAAQTTVLLFIIMMIGISLSYVIGVDGSRTMRQYYNAYPFLVLIPAAGIYAVSRLIKPRLSDGAMRLFDIGVVIAILYLSFSPTYAELNGVSAGGMATPQRWQVLQWVKQNTPAESRVFYLYGFDHEFEMLAERISLKGDMNLVFTQKNVVSLCNNQYPENYSGQWGAAFSVRPAKVNGTVEYPVYNGVLNFPFKTLYRPGTTTPIATVNDEVPLSAVDYVVFQYKGGQVDQCMAYFINESANRGSNIVWKNDQFAVIEVAR
jgi:hypothetical protein